MDEFQDQFIVLNTCMESNLGQCSSTKFKFTITD